MKLLLLVIAIFLSHISFVGSADSVKSSLLLLIDSSGSMGNRISGGNSSIKIESAKTAAIASVGRAVADGLVEVAILAFEGDCAKPVSRYINFSTDEAKLVSFINTLQPGGGTPMAEAILVAGNFMQKYGKSETLNQMIVLLADGQNDCGDVKEAIATLQSSGLVFRHETIGFGIESNSQAASDLRYIAKSTGGTYHQTNNTAQLANALVEMVDTLTVLDLFGKFKHHNPQNSKPSKTKPSTKPNHSIEMDLLDSL